MADSMNELIKIIAMNAFEVHNAKKKRYLCRFIVLAVHTHKPGFVRRLQVLYSDWRTENGFCCFKMVRQH